VLPGDFPWSNQDLVDLEAWLEALPWAALGGGWGKREEGGAGPAEAGWH